MNPETSGNEQKLTSMEHTKAKRDRFKLINPRVYLKSISDRIQINLGEVRGKIAELMATMIIHAPSTSKYPPVILDDPIFSDMDEEEKNFLKTNWHTFDLFRPKFEIHEDGSFKYLGKFWIYEVKSRVIGDSNKHELEQPVFQFSPNQKKFFDTCIQKYIPVTIFAVYFLADWEIEIAQFDYSEVKKEYSSPDPRYEEKMKRIRAAPFARFFNDLYPDMVLEKVDESKLRERNEEETYNFASMMAKNPDEIHKKILQERKEKRIRYKRSIRTPEVVDEPPISESPISGLSRAGQPWLKEEDMTLRREFAIRKTMSEMVKSHGRSRGGIRSRLRKLGLISRYDDYQ